MKVSTVYKCDRCKRQFEVIEGSQVETLPINNEEKEICVDCHDNYLKWYNKMGFETF